MHSYGKMINANFTEMDIPKCIWIQVFILNNWYWKQVKYIVFVYLYTQKKIYLKN